MSWKGDLLRAGIESDGSNVWIPGFQNTIGKGKAAYLSGGGSASYSGRSASAPKATWATAKDLLVTGRNDVLYVLPHATGISMASMLTWDLNLTHVVGLGAYGRMNMRTRTSMSANFATMLTISGYGNTFANLNFQHGRGNATNVNLLTLTGNRNTFINCHFNGPINTTEGDTAYDLIRISGEEYYFKSCFIGADNIFFTGNGAQAQASLIEFTASAAPRGVFEDCIFCMKADAVTPVFLRPMYDLSEASIWFINCAFLNIGTSALTYAIDYDGTATGLNANAQMMFHNCTFAGVTDIVPLGDESRVWFTGANTPVDQVTGGASVALFNGLASHPDVS